MCLHEFICTTCGLKAAEGRWVPRILWHWNYRQLWATIWWWQLTCVRALYALEHWSISPGPIMSFVMYAEVNWGFVSWLVQYNEVRRHSYISGVSHISVKMLNIVIASFVQVLHLWNFIFSCMENLPLTYHAYRLSDYVRLCITLDHQFDRVWSSLENKYLGMSAENFLSWL